MKSITVRSSKAAIVAIIIFAILSSSFAYAFGREVYTNTQWLADNLSYTNTISYSDTAERGESYSVALVGKGDAYPIVTKGDTVYGTLTLTKAVNYMESLGVNVLAAVNSDFFSMSTGVPMGIVIEDGEYISSPSERPAVCFSGNGGVSVVESPSVLISLRNNGGSLDSDNRGKTTSFSHLNKFRVDTGGMYLLTEHFSTVSTRTSSPGWFLKFKVLEGTLSVSGKMTLQVVGKQESDGSMNIEPGHMILTSAHQGGYGEEYDKFDVGDTVTLTTSCNQEALVKARYASGGGDILVSNGSKTHSSGWDSALLSRAPRTAFGVRKDGSIVSYVIDGRNPQHSVGMTMNELADEMLKQGCVYAVNFDGGGSSALSVRLPGDVRNTVVSMPSDGAERGCSTYIMFVTDARPDGAARNLSLANDGAVVLAGSSIDLGIAATDKGYMPVAAPSVVHASTSAKGASVEGLRYTAGMSAGIDVIELYSPSTGSRGVAYGTGSIFVITQPTSISAARRGSRAPVTSVQLEPGETLELNMTAMYFDRYVTAQPLSFTYTISGNIGEMTEPGVFKAGASMFQSGSLTISAGTASAVVRIEIGGFTDISGHWAKEYVEYLTQNGITKGISATEYGASAEMRRADYILMLYRAAGEPRFSNKGEYSDVVRSDYYAKAMAWARSVGITESTEDNLFYPQAPIERQDAFTFTYRALEILGKEYTDGDWDQLADFPDADTLDEYALIPTMTLIKLGVVEGMDGIISPHSTLTRAQMAKILAVTLQL